MEPISHSRAYTRQEMVTIKTEFQQTDLVTEIQWLLDLCFKGGQNLILPETEVVYLKTITADAKLN